MQIKLNRDDLVPESDHSQEGGAEDGFSVR